MINEADVFSVNGWNCHSLWQKVNARSISLEVVISLWWKSEPFNIRNLAFCLFIFYLVYLTAGSKTAWILNPILDLIKVAWTFYHLILRNKNGRRVVGQTYNNYNVFWDFGVCVQCWPGVELFLWSMFPDQLLDYNWFTPDGFRKIDLFVLFSIS